MSQVAMLDPPKTTFPENPTPLGLQVADRKQSKPLLKMLKMLAKPRTKVHRPKKKPKEWARKQTYY